MFNLTRCKNCGRRMHMLAFICHYCGHNKRREKNMRDD